VLIAQEENRQLSNNIKWGGDKCRLSLFA